LSTINHEKTKFDKKQIELEFSEEKRKIESSKEKFEQIWIFLDEINTCYSLGLITEILCKRTYLGKKLPDNLCFICACNPYRLFTNLHRVEVGLQVNKLGENIKNLSETLAYKVNPLPFSLLNYVFDFGSLTKNDELKYIDNMIRNLFDIKIKIKIIENIKDLIIHSQDFIREQNSEISSVSLRDIKRFIIFFRWFRISIITRAEKGDELYKIYLNDLNLDDLIIRSCLLSIFLIYYLRIPEKSIKKQFISMLSDVMKNYKQNYSEDNLLALLYEEQHNILNRVNPPPGIAWNSALLENVFAAFHCINNKVPVFICGKPGCSKSLAFQLIYSSLRGENSKDPYFKTLPRLIVNRYQGSTTSKSSGILNVFKKARNLIKGNSGEGNYNKNNEQEKIISLVYFDEMGLAEKSKNNPLKILHAELEPRDDKDKVAFIGISNYKIDASKANRGIFIARPDLDEEDMITIAITISESYKNSSTKFNSKNFNTKSKNNIINDISKYLEIFKALAIAYSKYKNTLFEKERGRYDFHGTRDFYFMIKNIAKLIANANYYLKNEEIFLIIENSINRNFSGFTNSLSMFKENLKLIDYPKSKSMDFVQKSAIQSIELNLYDYDSRYLMIIGESQVSINLLQNIISNFKNKNLENKHSSFAFMIGSQFENDIESNEKTFDEYNEEYSFKILSKIQIYMEQGNTLILCGLNSIYPSLYDLFNQNFSIVGGKKYSRIALGTSNNPLAYVHENFKCIIILNEDEVEKQDPPFLNRFEKTIINFESLLTEEYQKIAKDIFDKLKNNLIYEYKVKIQIKFDIMKNLINFNMNEFLALVNYYIIFESEYDSMRIEDKILEKIVPTFSQDIITLLLNNLYSQQKLEEFEKYRIIYEKNMCLNLEEFIWKKLYTEQIQKTSLPEISFVYTYTSIFDEILISQKEIKTESHAISSFKSEFDLEKAFSNFMKRSNNTFILKFRLEDIKMLNYSKFLCEQTLKNFIEFSNKLFIFIIYTSRVLVQQINTDNEKNINITNSVNLCDNKNNISFLYEGVQIFIDNLNANFYFEKLDRQHISGQDNNQNNDILNFNETPNSKDYKNNPNNITIPELIKISLTELINDKRIFKKEEIFSSALRNSYMRIYFDSENHQDDENKNYVENIIDFINTNNKLKEKIIFKALEAFPKQENWIEKIMNLKDLLVEKASLIEIIKLYLEKEFKINLFKIIFHLEKNDLLKYLLYNEEDIFLNKTIDAINYLSIGEVLIRDNVGGNIVKRIFGYKLPNSYGSFEIILGIFRENLLTFIQKEEEFRNSDFEDNEEYYYYIYEDIYRECKENSVSEFKYLLESFEKINYLFSNTNNPNSQINLLNNLFEDYLLFYQIKNLSTKFNNNEDFRKNPNEKFINLNEIKDILKFIIVIEFNKIEFSKENISKYIIFLESNTLIIQKYLDLFIIFKKYDYNYLNNLKNIIEEINYPSDHPTKYLQILNQGHYIISTAIINFTLKLFKNIEKFENQQIFDLLDEINIVKDNLVDINYSLILKIKSIKQIETIVLITLLIIKEDRKNICNFFKKLVELFEEESLLMKDGYSNEKINNNLKQTFDLIYEKIDKPSDISSGKDAEYRNKLNLIFIELFILKYKFYKNENRKNIVNLLLSKKDLLVNSKNFIQYFFYFNHLDEFDLTPYFNQENKKGDTDTFGNFAKMENYFIDKIEDFISSVKIDKDRQYLIQSIILIFEINFQKYFKLIKEEDINSKKIEVENKDEIINENNSAFKYFEKAYQIWENMNNNSNFIKENQIIYPFMLKLYVITYMKMYLEKYVDLNYKNSDLDFSNVNTILNRDNNQTLILKLYVIKILKEKYLTSWEEIESFDYIKHQMIWKNSSKELISQNNKKAIANNLYIDIKKIESYQKIELDLNLSTSKNFKDDDVNEIFADINNENLSLFLDAIINNIFANSHKEKKENQENLLFKAL